VVLGGWGGYDNGLDVGIGEHGNRGTRCGIMSPYSPFVTL
jgi:hypothetical protein